MTIYVLIFVTVVTVGLFVVMYFQGRKNVRDVQQMRAIIDHQDDYTFLLDDGFHVKQTNYYARGNVKDEGAPDLLGNVLHCKNAHKAGRCGESEECHSCPVRFVVGKAFERHEGFDGMEACMEIMGTEDQAVDVDVEVAGHYVELDKESHMVVNVRDITISKELKPKILFVSDRIALLDKVVRALGDDYRVLAADNLHQVMLRLMNLDTYQFSALITDDSFYNKNASVLKMLVKDGQLPVYVFTSNDSVSDDDFARYLPMNIGMDELIQRVSAFSSCSD